MGTEDHVSCIAEVEDEMCVVVHLDVDHAVLPASLGNGDARHRGDAAGGAEQPGHGLNVVDRGIPKRASAGFVVPGRVNSFERSSRLAPGVLFMPRTLLGAAPA